MDKFVWPLDNDWSIVRTGRVNTLLIGSRETTAALLAAIRPGLRGPVRSWRPGERLTLTDGAPVGTLILHEVAELPHVEQERLLTCLDRAPGVRVISTATASPLPRVEAGEFVETLFYRLNLITIDAPRSS